MKWKDNWSVEWTYRLTGLIWQPMTQSQLAMKDILGQDGIVVAGGGYAYFDPEMFDQRDGPMTAPYRKPDTKQVVVDNVTGEVEFDGSRHLRDCPLRQGGRCDCGDRR